MRGTPLLVMVCALLLAVVAAPSARAARNRVDADELKAGLKTSKVEEKGFIDRVVVAVDEKRLPASVVLATFHWARKKQTRKFQFFRVAMLRHAKTYRVKL